MARYRELAPLSSRETLALRYIRVQRLANSSSLRPQRRRLASNSTRSRGPSSTACRPSASCNLGSRAKSSPPDSASSSSARAGHSRGMALLPGRRLSRLLRRLKSRSLRCQRSKRLRASSLWGGATAPALWPGLRPCSGAGVSPWATLQPWGPRTRWGRGRMPLVRARATSTAQRKPPAFICRRARASACSKARFLPWQTPVVSTKLKASTPSAARLTRAEASSCTVSAKTPSCNHNPATAWPSNSTSRG